MRPYALWTVETFHSRHIATVSARSYKECRRKAWKAIAKKAPKLVPYFRENDFICLQQGRSGWGAASFSEPRY